MKEMHLILFQENYHQINLLFLIENLSFYIILIHDHQSLLKIFLLKEKFYSILEAYY